MRDFYSWYDNGRYKVGMTGSIWVYDRQEALIGRFRETPYSYIGAFVPGTNIFMSRTNECHIVLYDLEQMKPIKKIRTSNTGAAEDTGFAFTNDGQYLYCIQRQWDDWLSSQLTIYRTSDFEAVAAYFVDSKRMVLTHLEFDTNGTCYVLGFMRGKDGVGEAFFVGIFENGQITHIQELKSIYHEVSAYCAWRLSGFTDRAGKDARLQKIIAENPKFRSSLKKVYKTGDL